MPLPPTIRSAPPTCFVPWVMRYGGLGSEDPSIWSLLGRPYEAATPDELKTLVPGSDIDIEGEGEILKIAAEPSDGARTFEMDKTNQIITSETFTKIPTTHVIRRSGLVPTRSR